MYDLRFSYLINLFSLEINHFGYGYYKLLRRCRQYASMSTLELNQFFFSYSSETTFEEKELKMPIPTNQGILPGLVYSITLKRKVVNKIVILDEKELAFISIMLTMNQTIPQFKDKILSSVLLIQRLIRLSSNPPENPNLRYIYNVAIEVTRSKNEIAELQTAIV